MSGPRFKPIPPELLTESLAAILAKEGVEYEAAALPMLVMGAVNGFFSGRGQTWTVLGIEAFGLVGETDHRGRRSSTFFIRNDLHRAAFEHGDAAVGRP